MFGILAHSHSSNGTNSQPVANIENRLKEQHAQNPREQLDVVCVADLSSWFRSSFVVTEYLNDQLKQHRLRDFPRVQDVMFREKEVKNSGEVLGGLIFAILRRLAAFDPTIRPIAEGMRRVGTSEREGDVRAHWPPAEALSPATLGGVHIPQHHGGRAAARRSSRHGAQSHQARRAGRVPRRRVRS
ncbi:hypothetical protein [Mycolicibacterium peregrinum]|uniref:hypothetical protein n=1 Tax=Mycolicibacterium peregrinum TaxID=43304 RepID=UPI00104220AC|nr:hypothetical protein [Mycolicibacterium peregrinum]